MLDEFIVANYADITNRCRAKVAARTDPPRAGVAVDHGVPMFLDQLLDELRHGPSADLAITATATQHGHDMLLQGYTLSEVVHHYGDVCQAITELAVERRSDIPTEDFQSLNRCLDDAIAGAVTEYGRDRSRPEQGTGEGAPRDMVARDLLRAIGISQAAFAAIQSGKVGANGSAGTVVSMGLDTAHDLAKRLLNEE
jgi:hypothetical protein